MIAPFIINGERYVACPTRLGTKKTAGPVTGKVYLITFRGTWIDEADAEELVGLVEEIWCFRQERYIELVTIFNMDPPEREVRLKQRS